MDVLIALAEVVGIFAAVIGGGWVLSKTIHKTGYSQGEHSRDHEELRGDVDAAHEKLRGHDERITNVEKAESANAEAHAHLTKSVDKLDSKIDRILELMATK